MSQRSKILVVSLAAAATMFADDQSARGFTAQLQNCTEFVGTGPVPLAQAASLVPAGLTIAGADSGFATIVVRASKCATWRIERFEPESTTIAHVGIIITPPDATGDINNYTILYATNNERLAQRLEKAGVTVLRDADLVYEVTPDPPSPSGELYVEVTPRDAPGWILNGPEENNALFTIPFQANWWSRGRRGLVKMATVIPSITFQPAQMKVIARKDSTLGRLLGGNSFSNFNGYNVRGEFSTATMDVSLIP